MKILVSLLLMFVLTNINAQEKHFISTKTINEIDTIRYRLNGKLHRTDGPAIERADGSKFWYVDNKLHHTDGPAIYYYDGTKAWYVNGKCHRTNGPAIELSNGNKEWWINGKRHRTDGPAVEWANNKQWWIDGKSITLENYRNFVSDYPDLINQFLAYQALNE